jgi:hypothetical protein
VKAKTGKKKSFLIVAVGVAIAAIIAGSITLFGSQQPPSSQTIPQGNNNNNNNINKPMVMHIHPSITIVGSNGKHMPLTTDIGINSSLWKDHSLDQFGMQGMSPLHTHDSSGTVHVESNAKRDYSLGQFMDVWGGIDSSKIIKVTSDGIEVEDYVSHVFKDGERIIVEMAA